jgi:hypothetical protein
MGKKIIITEEEKKDIKSLYNITEQRVEKSTPKSPTFDIAKIYGSKSLFPANVLNKTTPDDDIYKSILYCIGAKPTKENMLFMYAWRQAEHSLYEKKIAAKNNPFNTTQPMNGATRLKGNTHGVKNYLTIQDGIKATCDTLKNGKYEEIINGFKNNVGLDKLKDSVASSPWGTSKDLLSQVTDGYFKGNEPKPGPVPRV